MKKLVKSISLVLALVICFSAGVYAAGNLEEIKAYLNYGVDIILDGQTQTMYDANGKQVFPITYQGTTYVPIRAVSNMLNVDVNWDGDKNAVILGEQSGGVDFIEKFKPYSIAPYQHYKVFPSAKNKNVEIAGKRYDHWIETSTNCGGYYDLGGKYKTLTFDSYSEFDTTIVFYGDNEEILSKFEIKGDYLPKTHIVDISNVQQLLITGPNFGSDSGLSPIYIFNATIE